MAASSLHGTILLVGAGRMGGALLGGWLARGLDPSKIVVTDPAPPAEVLKLLSEKKIARDPDPKSFSPDAIVLAIKPQAASEIVPKIASFVKPKTVVVSVMAGRTIASLESALPAFAAVVRSIPNTPASVGRGVTVAVANKRVDGTGRALVDDLLSAVGKVEWIEDERLIDAVTAVSGSGPAYVFYLTECIAKAGIAAGLPADLAMKLARETVSGSGEQLHQSKLDASKLRENVTSPGGTTAAALEILMGKDGLEALFTSAIAAATKRSRDLAG
jgi:pyrroline-5-carboxylate reductase